MRECISNDINEEVRIRNINTSQQNQRFINRKEDDDRTLESTGKRFYSLVFRAYKASKKLSVGFQFIKENQGIRIKGMDENKEEEEAENDNARNEKIIIRAGRIANCLTKVLQDMHKKNLQTLDLRRHSFFSLE
jgi:hypothetical protein